MKKRNLVNIYSNEVYLIFDCTINEFEAFLDKRFPDRKRKKKNAEYALFCQEEKDNEPDEFYLWVSKDTKANLRLFMVHEVEHLVFNLFDYIGIKHSDDSDEAYAYQQQDFCDQVFKLLKL